MKTIMIIDEQNKGLSDILNQIKSDDFQIITAQNNKKAIEIMSSKDEKDFGLILINTFHPDTNQPAFFSMKPGSKKNIDTTNESDFIKIPCSSDELFEFIKKKI